MSDIEIPEEAADAALDVLMDNGHNGLECRPQRNTEDVVRLALAAALPALRKQWAEEAAALADHIAEGHQKAAVDHRAIAVEIGSKLPKGARHMRTALSFKDRAAGAWEAAHAVREYGEGP